VRWAGEDLVVLGLDVRRALDGLLLGLVAGEPLDEVIRAVHRARQLADKVVDCGKDLQHAPDTNTLVEWAMADEAFLTVLESKIAAARRPPGSRSGTQTGGERQP